MSLLAQGCKSCPQGSPACFLSWSHGRTLQELPMALKRKAQLPAMATSGPSTSPRALPSLSTSQLRRPLQCLDSANLSPPQDICPCSCFYLEGSYLLLLQRLSPSHPSPLSINVTSSEGASLTSQLNPCLCLPSSCSLHLRTLVVNYDYIFTC